MEPSHASAVKLILSIGRSGMLRATGTFLRHQAACRNAGTQETIIPLTFPALRRKLLNNWWSN